MAFSFYAMKALSINSKIKLLDISYNFASILESLKLIKLSFEKISKKELVTVYGSIIILIIFANFLINDKTDFSNFYINSL